jgi:hypothetical protein
MTQGRPPGPTIERLAAQLVAGGPTSLADELATWLAGSSRFRAFAETHRDKIRKKLRTASDAEGLRDVRVELLAARLLLADRRFEVAFEAYGSGRLGPDFSATFRGTQAFNLEVTRMRRAPDADPFGERLLAKLRQLPPSAANVLLVAIEGPSAHALEVAPVARALRARADAKDEAFFARRGFDGTRAFYERYLRLSAVIVWCAGAAADGAAADERAMLWTNGSARIAAPKPAASACLASLRAGGSAI